MKRKMVFIIILTLAIVGLFRRTGESISSNYNNSIEEVKTIRPNLTMDLPNTLEKFEDKPDIKKQNDIEDYFAIESLANNLLPYKKSISVEDLILLRDRGVNPKMIELGHLFAEINNIANKNSLAQDKAKVFYQSCSKNEEILNQVRALCISYFVKYSPDGEWKDLMQNLEPNLVSMARKISFMP